MIIIIIIIIIIMNFSSISKRYAPFHIFVINIENLNNKH